uniref:Uncharacterized protein n=1 Tax=Glossina brevipalpis TaxID=37001 RepID=A0A1A9WM25_9MUSC
MILMMLRYSQKAATIVVSCFIPSYTIIGGLQFDFTLFLCTCPIVIAAYEAFIIKIYASVKVSPPKLLGALNRKCCQIAKYSENLMRHNIGYTKKTLTEQQMGDDKIG